MRRTQECRSRLMPGAQTASRKQQRSDEPIDLSKSPLQYPQSVFRSSALFQLSRELGKPCDSAILRKVLQVHDVLTGGPTEARPLRGSADIGSLQRRRRVTCGAKSSSLRCSLLSSFPPIWFGAMTRLARGHRHRQLCIRRIRDTASRAR